MSAITCTQFLISSPVSLNGRKVTLITPGMVTVAEAKRRSHAALDSVGLAVEPSGNFLRIVEVKKKAR